MYYERNCLDRTALGEDICGYARDRLQQTPLDIHSLALDCADVIFDELVSDPIGTVKKVYQHFDWQFTEEYEEILKRHLAEDAKKRALVRRRKGGVSALHEHDLGRFGLREEDLANEEVFREYVRRYGMQECKK